MPPNHLEMLAPSILCGCHLQYKGLRLAMERKEEECGGSLGRFYGLRLELVYITSTHIAMARNKLYGPT